MSTPSDAVEDLLFAASQELVPATTDRRPWSHGWYLDAYRRSPDASLPGPSGAALKLTLRGLVAFEGAMGRLLREAPIQRRWEPDWLWGDVALLVVDAATRPDPKATLTAAVDRLRRCGPSLVAMPIANAVWMGEPIVLAGSVIGLLDERLVAAVTKLATDRVGVDGPFARDWIETQLATDDTTSREVVVLVMWTAAQSRMAEDEARARIDNLCALALLLEPDPGAQDLWSLRGNANRPSVRGLTPDRKTLEELLQPAGRGRFEILSEPLVLSDDGQQLPTGGWYSASPVPLDALLSDADRRSACERCLVSNDVIPRRVRVAARWYSEAHWAFDQQNAALALGVALDAMISAQHGLPGKLLAQRFAYLEPDPTMRRERAVRWNEIYQLRSTVAHGGESSKLSGADFVRGVAQDVVWAAARLLEFDRRFSPISEKDFEEVGDRLRMGELKW